MKKIICVFLSFILIISVCISAFASDDTGSDSDSTSSSVETTQNASQPKLLVESYTLSKSRLLPNESATLQITLKNYSQKKSVNNITVSISDETGEVNTQELNSNYIEKIIPNGEYVLTKTLKVSKSAVEGTHKLSISCEYEDDDFITYATSSQIALTVLKVKETTTKPSTTQKETTQNASHPQLIITSYSLDNDFVSPSKSSMLHITLKNESKNKTIKNLKITFSEEKSNIKFKKESIYIGDIKPKGTKTISLEISASKTAEIGEHKIVVSGEYEDKYYAQFTSTDNITVNVKQKTNLDYDGIILPKRIVQDDTVTMEVNLMNTGKSLIRNAKISFDIDSLQTGGVLFFGEIKAGENKNESVNFQASSTKLGKINGTATLSYEDEFGKAYSEKINLSSEIIKKKVTKQNSEEKKTAKYPLWWLFSIVGLAVGSGITAGIILAINSNKKRKEDEKRL